jgi:hypothetical protein
MMSFLILSCLVLPHIQCNIIIFTSLTLCCCWFFPPNTLSHTTLYVFSFFDKKFPFNLIGTFTTHKAPETLLYFNHQSWIRCFTSPFIPPSFCTIYPTFTSKLETLCLLLKLHSIYYVLLILLRRNPYVSKKFL